MSAYSEKVMDHFQHPRNMGEIENASGVGTVGNAKCGDIMRIFLDIDDDGIIRDVKFKTFGCGAAPFWQRRPSMPPFGIMPRRKASKSRGWKNPRAIFTRARKRSRRIIRPLPIREGSAGCAGPLFCALVGAGPGVV